MGKLALPGLWRWQVGGGGGGGVWHWQVGVGVGAGGGGGRIGSQGKMPDRIPGGMLDRPGGTRGGVGTGGTVCVLVGVGTGDGGAVCVLVGVGVGVGGGGGGVVVEQFAAV